MLAFDVGAADAAPVLWKHRDSVPSGWWAKMVRAAEKRGYRLTLAILAGLKAGAAKGSAP